MEADYSNLDDYPAPSGNTAPARTSADITIQETQTTGQRPTTTQQKPAAVETNVRRKNPLSKFSSWTYGLTLYMLSPEAKNYYVAIGTLPPSSNFASYAIVAQSGGINLQEPRGLTQSGIPGPGQPGLDFYIEDLALTTTLLGADGSKTATISYDFTFKIIEPTGFTFLTRLRNLTEYMNQNSQIVKGSNKDVNPTLYQQFYMIGVKFYGYDVDGNMLDTSKVPDSENVMNDPYAIYQRLFPLTIHKADTTINGRNTVYNISATIADERVGFGSVHGTIKNQTTLEGITVAQVLGNKNTPTNKSLIGYLNATQGDLKDQKNQEKVCTYDLTWVNNSVFDSTKIANGYLVTDADWTREVSPMMKSVNTPKDATVKISTQAQTSNSKSKQINIAAGQPITGIIDQIIVQSSYVVETLTKEVNSRVEAITKDNSTNKNFQWYSIKPLVSITGRDELRRDWVYNINYEIIPYEVPYVKSNYVNKRSLYRGPVKLYEYTLTGGNSEVINFEMSYNNLFFVAQPTTTSKDASGASKTVSSATPQQPTSAENSNKNNTETNRAKRIAQSVRANLYSVGDAATATIKIMGDPDFLMDSIGFSSVAKSFTKFHSDNYSINPYGGQIFCEIVFKLGEDYKQNGLLDVDLAQTIAFYPLEKTEIINNQGLIYKIQKVHSTFSKGKFEQTLDLFMVPDVELMKPSDEAVREQAENQRQSGRANLRALENESLEETRNEEVRTNSVASIREIDNRIAASQNTSQQARTTAPPTRNTPAAQSALDDSNPSAGSRAINDDYFVGSSTVPQASYVSTPTDIDLTAPAPSTIEQARVGESTPYEGKL